MKNTIRGDYVVTRCGSRGFVEAVMDSTVYVSVEPNIIIAVDFTDIISNPEALRRVYNDCPID